MKKSIIIAVVLAISTGATNLPFSNPGENQVQAAALSERRQAFVRLVNKTGATYKLQVLHQYTGDATQESEWIELAPNAEVTVMKVTYTVGFGTTGVDNWIINGIERRKLSANLKAPAGSIPIVLGGETYLDIRYKSGSGAGADWKVHTLRNNDHGKNTRIEIYPTTVEFKSESGTSSTKWNPEWTII